LETLYFLLEVADVMLNYLESFCVVFPVFNLDLHQ
jgi:hypothetical protein